MNILRQLPFPLEISYSDLAVSTDFILEIYDDHSGLIITETVTSNGSGVVDFVLPTGFEKFDGAYSVYLYTIVDDLADETVVIDTLYIYRPYINPLTLTDDECDQEEYINLERTARQIIDTLVGGFYYTVETVETSGLGADFIPLPKRANKINQVWENNSPVYNRLAPISGQDTYVITPDKTAMTVQASGIYNRLQSKSVEIPLAPSDSFTLYSDNYDQQIASKRFPMETGTISLFPKNWDYVVFGEFGWPVVPQDIKDAAKMLIDDIQGGKLLYVNKYISEYQTDQFRVKYNDLSLKGSGNLLVDKILQKYSIPIYGTRVL